jgi:hypothetical protein
MVRDAARRTTTYTAKIVGDVVKNRIDALKDSMVEQATDQFAAIVQKEQNAVSLLDSWGITSIQKPFYLSYIRRLYGLVRKHTGATLIIEACIATKAFKDRGLNAYRLQQLADNLYGIDVSASTA